VGEDIAKVHAYQGLVRQAMAEVEWAREGLRLVDRLEDAAPAETEEAKQA
jgi:hypothetical protein